MTSAHPPSCWSIDGCFDDHGSEKEQTISSSQIWPMRARLLIDVDSSTLILCKEEGGFPSLYVRLLKEKDYYPLLELYRRSPNASSIGRLVVQSWTLAPGRLFCLLSESVQSTTPEIGAPDSRRLVGTLRPHGLLRVELPSRRVAVLAFAGELQKYAISEVIGADGRYGVFVVLGVPRETVDGYEMDYVIARVDWRRRSVKPIAALGNSLC
jgi:hypothetical protein